MRKLNKVALMIFAVLISNDEVEAQQESPLFTGQIIICGNASPRECQNAKSTRVSLVTQLLSRCRDGNADACSEALAISDLAPQLRQAVAAKKDEILSRSGARPTEQAPDLPNKQTRGLSSLSSQKCFAGMHNPAQIWNNFAVKCVNENNERSCLDALSFSGNPDCKHEFLVRLSRIALSHNRADDAMKSAQLALQQKNTSGAWAVYGASIMAHTQISTQTKLKEIDKTIAALTAHDGELSEPESILLNSFKLGRESLNKTFLKQMEDRDNAMKAAEQRFNELKAKCPSKPTLSGKPTFIFSSGATNYERAALAFASSSSTGVVAEMHDDRKKSDIFNELFSQSLNISKSFICVKQIKYIRHITSESIPGGKMHIAEVQVSAVDRDKKDIEIKIELPYPD